MRTTLHALAALLIALLTAAMFAPAAGASTTQTAMFESDTQLYENPVATLSTLRSLGVDVVRVNVPWDEIACADIHNCPRPQNFNGADPNSPSYNFTRLDPVVRAAPAYGITIDLSVTGGAPLWATAPGAPKSGGPYTEWRPNATEYGRFVQAVATRYDGHFRPPGQSTLPAVHMWELWNEPNFGPDLAPQADRGSDPTAAALYRGLVDAGWSALVRTHHGHDTVILGNLDARGYNHPGMLNSTQPVRFIRALYCVDSHLRALRGAAARAAGCPTTTAGQRKFRANHSGLFTASGFGDHPYPSATPPNGTDTRDPDDGELVQIPHMTRVLDAIQRHYGSGHRFAIYDTEYGYITDPPNKIAKFPSPAKAAAWINWAEYIHYTNPRLVSYMQFLLTDPNPYDAPEYGGFASGLFFFNGNPKPSFDAYRLPLYLPSTTVKHGHSVLVWGCARPSHAYRQHRVVLQYRIGKGAFRTIATVNVRNVRGYFETHVRPSRSGALRLAWTYPGGATVYSRTVNVTVK